MLYHELDGLLHVDFGLVVHAQEEELLLLVLQQQVLGDGAGGGELREHRVL